MLPLDKDNDLGTLKYDGSNAEEIYAGKMIWLKLRDLQSSK